MRLRALLLSWQKQKQVREQQLINLQNANFMKTIQNTNWPQLSNEELFPLTNKGSSTARTRNDNKVVRLNQESLSEMTKVFSPVQPGARPKRKHLGQHSQRENLPNLANNKNLSIPNILHNSEFVIPPTNDKLMTLVEFDRSINFLNVPPAPSRDAYGNYLQQSSDSSIDYSDINTKPHPTTATSNRHFDLLKDLQMSGLKGISSTHQFFKRERLKKLKEAEKHLAQSQRQLEDGGGFNQYSNEANEGPEQMQKSKGMARRSIEEHGSMSQDRPRQKGRGKTQNEGIL